MMKSKNCIYRTALFISLLFIVPKIGMAQYSIGASYEIRNEEPKNGFGIRAERQILSKIPIIQLGLRAHFSYFNEDNYVGKNGIKYGSIKNYDYGLAATGGISVGLVTPYIGTGLGSTTTDLKGKGKESNIFWNGFVGAKFSPIPILNPFVEYRFKAADSFDELRSSVDRSNGRLIFGISLAF